MRTAYNLCWMSVLTTNNVCGMAMLITYAENHNVYNQRCWLSDHYAELSFSVLLHILNSRAEDLYCNCASYADYSALLFRSVLKTSKPMLIKCWTTSAFLCWPQPRYFQLQALPTISVLESKALLSLHLSVLA